jgi:hypothetical protein
MPVPGMDETAEQTPYRLELELSEAAALMGVLAVAVAMMPERGGDAALIRGIQAQLYLVTGVDPELDLETRRRLAEWISGSSSGDWSALCEPADSTPGTSGFDA